jgi:hypothetical protein
MSTLSSITFEAPGIIKRNGVYYLFASHTSGWAPNPNKVVTTVSRDHQVDSAVHANLLTSGFRKTTIYDHCAVTHPVCRASPAHGLLKLTSHPKQHGPMTLRYIGPLSSLSFAHEQLQNAYDLPLGSNAIYMGDRWRSDLLGSSRYVWFPLSWSSGSPQLVAADVWSVDVNAGSYTVASGTTYEAESGTKGGSATSISLSTFSGGQGVGYLGGMLCACTEEVKLSLSLHRPRWHSHPQ